MYDYLDICTLKCTVIIRLVVMFTAKKCGIHCTTVGFLYLNVFTENFCVRPKCHFCIKFKKDVMVMII